MRLTYRVKLASGGDERAPGGAITVALCGHWDHDGTCRFPHHTSRALEGDVLVLDVDITCDRSDEDHVRGVVDGAVASGVQAGPDGHVSRWSCIEG